MLRAHFSIKNDCKNNEIKEKFLYRFDYPKKKDLKLSDKNLIIDKDEDCLYFCGNSLGLKPVATDRYIKDQLKKWAKTYKIFKIHNKIL